MAASRVLFEAGHLIASGTAPPQGRAAAAFFRHALLQRGARAEREDLGTSDGFWRFRLEIEARTFDFRIRLLDLGALRPYSSNPLAHLEWGLEVAPGLSGLPRLLAPLFPGLRDRACAPAVARLRDVLQADPGISNVRWLSAAAYRRYLRRNRVSLKPEASTPFAPES